MINVLLVDDEEGLLELGRVFLSEMGDFNIVTARSVDEALAQRENMSFDAVVSDYQMPLRTGLDLLQELRGRRDHIPFILFTGRGREEVVIDAINHGADYYVKKDTDVSTQYAQLSHTIEQAVMKKQAIDAVDYNLNLFKELIENSLDIIVVLDVDGRVEYVSPSVHRVLGYQEREVIGRRNKDFVRPEVFDFIDDYHNKAIMGGPSRPFRLDLRKKDGTWATMEVIVKLYERDGRRKVIMNARDITDRVLKDKELERLMSEMEDRNKMIEMHIATSHLGMVVFDLDDKMMTLSARASEMYGLGRSKRKIGLEEMRSIIHPEDLSFWVEKMKYLGSTDEPIMTRYRVVLPTKEVRYHYVMSSTLTEKNGRPHAIMAFISDVTEMIKFQKMAMKMTDLGHKDNGL